MVYRTIQRSYYLLNQVKLIVMKTDIEILMGVLESKNKSWWSSNVFTPQTLIDILLEFTKEKERLEQEEQEAEWLKSIKWLEESAKEEDLWMLQHPQYLD